MEVLSCINMIQSKLMKGEKLDSNYESFSQNVTSSSEWNLMHGKQQIVEGLKEEVMQKCQQKLTANASHPRVKIQRLSMKQVEAQRFKMRLSYMRKIANKLKQSGLKNPPNDISSRPELEEVQLKLEESDQDPLEQDDMAVDNFDDIDNDYESEEEKFKKSQTPVNRSSAMTNIKPKRKMEFGKYSIISGTNKLETGSSTFSSETGKYRCNTCLNEYASHASFKLHYNVAHLHTKFKCNICSKVFNQLSSFGYHHKIVHGRVRLKCGLCDALFTMIGSLRKHITRKHKDSKHGAALS